LLYLNLSSGPKRVNDLTPPPRSAKKDVSVKKQYLIAAGKYLLGFGILFWVIWRNWESPDGKAPGLKQALENPIQIWPLAACAVIYMAGVFLTFVRWFVLVRAQDLPLSFLDAIRLGLVGFYFSSFLPSSIGGDLVKAVMIAREQKRRAVAVSTVLIDRGLGLWGLTWVIVLLGTIFWLFGNPILRENDYLRLIVFTASLVIGASLVVCLILLALPPRRATIFAGRLLKLPKIGHALAEIWGAVWIYRLKMPFVAGALLISISSHICFVLAFYFAGQILVDPRTPGAHPTLSQDFLIVPVGLAVQAVFPSPGGVGAGEEAFARLYKIIGQPEAAGVFASMAQRIVVWGLSFLGFLVYVQMKPEIPIEIVEQDVVMQTL
jgi:uncharacterized membrane protein YbhN (UPF0104 family)